MCEKKTCWDAIYDFSPDHTWDCLDRNFRCIKYIPTFKGRKGNCKQATYNSNCIKAVLSFPKEVLSKIIPYSKEELKEIVEEDPFLDSIDYEKSWAFLIETEDFKNGKQKYLKAKRWAKGWNEQKTEEVINIMKIKFPAILKQAIRLYVNFSRFTLPND